MRVGFGRAEAETFGKGLSHGGEGYLRSLLVTGYDPDEGSKS